MDAIAKTKFATVEEYHAAYPEVREKLEAMREIIRQAAPTAEEVISYNMPGFRLNGMLVWYAACKDHIGFYPSASPIKVFAEELAGYKTSKGAIQFPLTKTLPKALVKKIVKYRVNENLEKALQKAKKKK